MYEGYYGLKDKPFSMLPDPGFLFLGKKHQAALTLLEYGLMNNVGFCVISGETGAGKTTLLRKLLERIDDSYTVGMITNTHQSFGSLLDWVLAAFNQHATGLSQVEMHQKLMDFVIAEYANNKKVLLIVDEAQNMKVETLEELRMLSNVNSEKDQLMQVILAGQPALQDTLRIPELMQFAQRIGVDYHLGALDIHETCQYIQHRLVTAGASRDIFTPAACARIYHYTGGTPRLINLLCDTVMVYGFADQQEMIDIELVDEMVQERMKDSVVPLVNRECSEGMPEELMQEVERDFPWISSQSDAIDNTGSSDKPLADNPDRNRFFKDPEPAVEAPVYTQESEHKDRFFKTPEVQSEKGDELLQAVAEEIRLSDIDVSEQTQPADHTSEIPVLTDTRSVVNTVEVFDPLAEQDEPKSHWAFYAVAGLVVLAVLFILFKSEIMQQIQQIQQHVVENDAVSQRQLEQQHAAELALEQEKIRLRQEVEAARREKEEALARLQLEKKRAAEKAAAEVEAALKAAALAKEKEAERLKKEALAKQRRAEAEAKKARQRALRQERKAREAAARAKAEAAAAKKRAAELEEQKRMAERRLQEEQRLMQLEQERLAKEKAEQELLAIKKSEAAALAAEAEQAKAAASTKNDNECSGPAARFKSHCR